MTNIILAVIENGQNVFYCTLFTFFVIWWPKMNSLLQELLKIFLLQN